MDKIVATIFIVFVIWISWVTIVGNNNKDKDLSNEERVYELEECLEEYKDSLSEYKYAVNEAYSNLNYWGEGDDYNDLISAIRESSNTLDIGDRTPTCE